MFWRSALSTKLNEYHELERQFADFQETSKDIEKELEEELSTSEKKLKDTTAQLTRVKLDNENILVPDCSNGT